MSQAECKALESKLRRRAQRCGLNIIKSRRRDPDAPDFGKYMILELQGRRIAASGLEFNELAEYLAAGRRVA